VSKHLNIADTNGTSPGPIEGTRLEGDDLFAWAKLTSAVAQANANLNEFGARCLKNYGYPLGQWLIDDDGYVISIQTMRRRQAELAQAQQGPLIGGPVTIPGRSDDLGD
jgi:hypothetical protein